MGLRNNPYCWIANTATQLASVAKMMVDRINLDLPVISFERESLDDSTSLTAKNSTNAATVRG